MRKKTLSIVLDAFIVLLVITIVLLIVMIVKRGKVTVDEENPFLALRNGDNAEEDYDEDADVPFASASANSASSNEAAKPTEEVEDNNIYAEVTGDTVNIRRGAGTDYERLGSASKGETFILEAVLSNGWSRVQYKTGQGFISSEYLRFVKKRPDGNIEVDASALPTE